MQVLAWQLCGCISITLWSGVLTAAYFLVCKLLKVLRAPVTEEERGLDWPTCGEVAYPFHAHTDGWIVGVDNDGNYVKVEIQDAVKMHGLRNMAFAASADHLAAQPSVFMPNPQFETHHRDLALQNGANGQNENHTVTGL